MRRELITTTYKLFSQKAAEAFINEFFEFRNNTTIYAERRTVMLQDVLFPERFANSDLSG